jgi:hypothetical protein
LVACGVRVWNTSSACCRGTVRGTCGKYTLVYMACAVIPGRAIRAKVAEDVA